MVREEIISKIINILKDYKVTDKFIIGENYSTIKTEITRKNMKNENLTITDIEEKIDSNTLLFHYSIYYSGIKEEDCLCITINNMIVDKAMMYKYIEVWTKKILYDNKRKMIENNEKTLQLSLSNFESFYDLIDDAKKEEIELIVEHNVEEIFKFINYKASINAKDNDNEHKCYSIDINIELTELDGKQFVISVIKNYLYFILRPEIIYTYYKVIIPISDSILNSFFITEKDLCAIVKDITYDDSEYNIYINDSGLIEIESTYHIE